MATDPMGSIQWIPEDDLLLKNAVEAGASLEALAKGAVQFSHRYTLQELHERWYSLLYDPDIAIQASDRMFELEISGMNLAPKLNRSENNFTANKEVSQKRKSESIRRKYYAMRKKYRGELFSNSDLGFFEHNPHEFSGHGANFQKQVMHDGNSLGQNCMIRGGITDHLGLQEEDLDILQHAFPGTIRDIAVVLGGTNVPLSGCPDTFGEKCQNKDLEGYGEQAVMFASGQSNLRRWRKMQDVSDPSVPISTSLQDTAQVGEDITANDAEGKENSSAVYSGEFADPDSLLNLSNEDEILLEDVDGKHAANKSCTDNIDSVLQDSNKDDHGNEIEETELQTVTASEVSCVSAPSANPVVFEVPSSSIHEERQMNCQPEVDVPLKTVSNSDPTRLSDGRICCTLNTEDQEIPCNDDIFLLIHPSTSFDSSIIQSKTTGSLTSTAHEKSYGQALRFPTKAKDSTNVFVLPHTVGIHGLPESHVVHPLLGCTAQTESHDSRLQAVLPGCSNKTIADSSKGESLIASPNLGIDSLAKKEVAGVDMKVGNNLETVTEYIRSTEVGSRRTQLPESVVDESVSDQEESIIDDDAPYFSDIEAMILEMDLVPYYQDSHIVRQVPSYQYDDTKRTIIRLEQAARSCLKRAMRSQCALAVLYGRYLRHYMRKPEVLLGRSTDDADVDIDLRKEGRANKVSRRQAIIKMEEDGSFFLKNLGKSPVSVNGIAVPSGQLMNLSSSCLIEIKGMSFVFEINQGYVKEHLASFFLKNKGKKGKTDWLAEDES